MLKRLERRDTWRDTAFELRVLANLIRAGYAARRIAEVSSHRTPDLEVRVGVEAYELELKGVNDSPIDEAADVISEALLRAEVNVGGFHLELRGSEELSARALEDARSVVAEVPQIVGRSRGVALRSARVAVSRACIRFLGTGRFTPSPLPAGDR